MEGTEGCNNPTPSPSFRGAGAETVAMVTTALWSGDFSFSSPPLLFSKQQQPGLLLLLNERERMINGGPC